MNDIVALLPHIKLKFNINNPTYEESYLFGYECALSDIAEEENPYKEGSQKAEQWLEGWWAGFYGEQPLFDSNQITPKAKEMHKESLAYQSQQQKSSFLTLMFEISGTLAASVVVGYQLFEFVA